MQVVSHQDSREKSICRITCLVALYLIFKKQVNLQWGIVPTQLNEWGTQDHNVLRQIHAFFSTRGLPASSYSDSLPPTTETAIFMNSHMKTWLFSLPEGICDWIAGSFYNCYWIAGTFYNCTNGKLPWIEFETFLDWNSDEGTLLTIPVYYLPEHSMSQFQMWTFHFALNSTFSSGFW